MLTKVDEYQTELAKQVTEIANLQTKIRQQEEDYTKRLNLAQQTIREIRDRLEREEGTLDKPDGYVTYVDHRRGEVRTNLTRSMGFRPQLTMTVFDSQSPGTPTDKPKGTVELVQVGDRDSVARIVKTNNPVRPDPRGRHRVLARHRPLSGDADRPGRQDRHQPRRQG